MPIKSKLEDDPSSYFVRVTIGVICNFKLLNHKESIMATRKQKIKIKH